MLGEACLPCTVQSTHEKYVSDGMQTDMTLLWHGLSLHLLNMTHKSKVHFQTVGGGRCKLGCRMRENEILLKCMSFELILLILEGSSSEEICPICASPVWLLPHQQLEQDGWDWGGVWVGLWVIRVEEWQFVSGQCIS